MLQQLKERHKDDPQAVLAKTPMGKKMMGASGRRQGTNFSIHDRSNVSELMWYIVNRMGKR